MDLGPQTDVYPCPNCGVDAARAMMVSAAVAFYQPVYACPRCSLRMGTLQAAANHMAEHVPDLPSFVRWWIEKNEPQYEIRRKGE